MHAIISFYIFCTCKKHKYEIQIAPFNFKHLIKITKVKPKNL